MGAKIFHQLMTPDQARKVLSYKVSKLIKTKLREIQKVSGMIPVEDVYSTEDIPPFDRAEVDGYAINHESITGAEEDTPRELRLIGEVEVGKAPEIEIGKGTTAYISTGSIIPRGADSVVMVEYTTRTKSRVKVFRSISAGENIAHAGSDFFVGEPLIRKGKTVTPEGIALLASSGIGKIRVLEKLRVGIISTGNELLMPGDEIRLGSIYDSNSYYFKSALEGTGIIECSILGRLKDDKKSMKAFIEGNMNRYEALISSGSTSAGFHDLLYQVIEDLGGEMIFHGISIKPGKPTFLASFGESLFVGMPGFPLSAGSVLRYIVIPAILNAYGLVEEVETFASLPFRINSEKGKDLVLPAIIGRSGRAYPIFGDSGSISRLAYADGFLVIKNKKNYYERDEKVPFFPLMNRKRDLLFIGSNDPLIERIIFEASESPVVINAGSWGGVEAIKLGEADVSGVHLLREGEYNSFLIREDDKSDYLIVRGFSRTQGFVSKLDVSRFSEIVGKNLIFINRNKGSGTRDLIDEAIEKELGQNFKKDKIRGYFWEAKSHAAVAKAVQQGRGDVGISIEFYAKILHLKFHKIRDENYDILIQREFYNSNVGKRFLSRLRASSKYARDFPGYKFPENIGEFIS
ncbi:MAG: molybdopterin biosynthesis protein [Thermoplasmatales archaeon]|nr:molybdopterin biosynthesis protein [Candidatus Thermoplasmatota archaeon]MCL6002748.1 molybdopterin biosynthesis protein [Candidatus Thermoplasmatota archaeon]MDA8054235.1 molybdopterin biosynthesis protein [Thermoplasmatales archaeon]